MRARGRSRAGAYLLVRAAGVKDDEGDNRRGALNRAAARGRGRVAGTTPRPHAADCQMFRRGTPTFEMHVVPRAEVERVIRAHGGELLQAIDDNAAGDRWLSYTYVCRKG